ncbi:MAG TPA: pitrilysin family protein, partial [bacterium]|nr:pitrilysin family protein [bacterium]
LSAMLCLLVLSAGAVAPALADTLEDKDTEFELDNGMKFIVIERHEAPVVFCAVGFKVGAIYERPGITGISHLLEHMLFKGTETIGTKDFDAEREFLAREDELAEASRDLMLEIGAWRLEYLDEYSTELTASMSDEDREAVGSDRGLELELLIEMLKERGPGEDLAALTGLLEDEGKDFFDLYLTLKGTEMELYDVMAEHRELIISNELWETYMNNGSRMLNAGTSNDGTFYFSYLPANRLELFMLIESDRMANPIFREFYTERDVVNEELRMSLNDPGDVLYYSFLSTAYTASMYGVPVLGWASDISMVTRQDLQDYFDTNYAPNNAVGFFAGDVDPDELKKQAEKYFGKIDRGPDLPELITREPKQQGERRVVVKQDAKPSLMIGYHVPANPHPDSYALTALQSILSSGRTSRFYKDIYEEQGLTREAPGAWMGPGDRLDPLFTISADPKDPHTLAEVEAAIMAELERAKTEPVGMRELERVWNQNEAELVRAMGSNMGLAFRVGFYAAMRGDWRALMTDMERMKQVTPEDIMRVAEKYFTEENRTVAWLVETESENGESEEEIDFREIMVWAQTLPEAEQMELMQKFQTLDDAGRQALAQELWDRMKAEQEKS